MKMEGLQRHSTGMLYIDTVLWNDHVLIWHVVNMEDKMDGLFDLLKRVAALKRAPKTRKGKYPASRSPYKPVLLLAVLRRIQQGKDPYAGNKITYEECAKDFTDLYSRLYGERHSMDSKVTQAFWYLGTGKPKIWSLRAKADRDGDLKRLEAARAQIKTARKLNELVDSAHFSDADWNLIKDSDVQQALISFVMSGHFPDLNRELAHL